MNTINSFTHNQPDTLDRQFPGQAPSTETLERVYFGDQAPLKSAYLADPLNTDIPLPASERAGEASMFDTMIGNSGIIIPESAPLIGDPDTKVKTSIYDSLTQELAALTDPDAVARELGITTHAPIEDKTPKKTQPFIKIPGAAGQMYQVTGNQAAIRGSVPTPRPQAKQAVSATTLSLEDMKAATRILGESPDDTKSDGRASRLFTSGAETLTELEREEARMEGRQNPQYGTERVTPDAPESVKSLHDTISRTAQLDGAPIDEAHDTATNAIKAIGADQNMLDWAASTRPKGAAQHKERRSFREKMRSGMERISPRKAVALGAAAIALTGAVMVSSAQPIGNEARHTVTVSAEMSRRTPAVDTNIVVKPEVAKPKAQEAIQPKVVAADQQEDMLKVTLPKYNAETQAGTPWKAAADMLREAGEKDPSRREIRALTKVLLESAGVSMAHADELHRGAMLQAARADVERIMRMYDDEADA